ncbi:MAG: hypothetical protein AB1705_26670, partial [Verrucomicrobiota bacterium]
TGDPMYDTYIFSQNGSNITVQITGLEAGRYHFYLYGHADADVTGEQNSVFTLHSTTNTFGPMAGAGSTGWKATSAWQERQQYVVFRDVPVEPGQPVTIEVAPGANGIAVLNGLQIISRGTSPPILTPVVSVKVPATSTNLVFREIHYDGNVTDTEARFQVKLDVESLNTNELSAAIFQGDIAVLAGKLPDGVRIVSAPGQFRLFVSKPGQYQLNLEVVAKITRHEPWNQISFTGPPAAIASVSAVAAGNGVELQLLSGTQMTQGTAKSRVQGFLGADRLLSLRWQSKAAEITRKSLITVDTTGTTHITPTVVKFVTKLKYEILQAPAARLNIALPANHLLTRLQGPQIRDWQVKPDGARQLLTVEFIKPVEKAAELTLYTEAALEAGTSSLTLMPPQPLEVERESGSLSISAEEMLVEIESVNGLRQVNAGEGALAAYRFFGRPATLTAGIKRIEPVVTVGDRVSARLEETRLLVGHALTLKVEKAGIYAFETTVQPGLTVTDVRGEGVDDWKVTDGKLRVSFGSRVLGARQVQVQMEQVQAQFPDQVAIAPLRVTGAARETAHVGAAAIAGVRLKTAEMNGLREMPVANLPNASDELLGYIAEQADWSLSLATERLAPRVVADVFNLITIGDGLVGGSATIRYGIVNQGVQEFKVRLPAHWKNVEFTGPTIRRKELAPMATNATHQEWTITLQDKAWGGYTLVVTYDHQFDPNKATLNAAGARTVDLERETGSVAITTAASLKLEPKSVTEPLRQIDPTELAQVDRALITRPVLLAYRYPSGADYKLEVNLTRHEQIRVLDAVADRTQLTTVLTEAGQMLTQASFMVKNNDKQFQRFELPADAQLWGCYVNGEPVKAERDGAWTLVSLPRTANRDEAFAVDIVYAQQIGSLNRVLPKSLSLAAPKTDVPNTYAEWQVYVPPTQRLSSFDGTMTVARGTTYGLREAWLKFQAFYTQLWNALGFAILFIGGGIAFCAAAFLNAKKRGWNGVMQVVGVFALLGLVAAMVLPGLSKSRRVAQSMRAPQGAPAVSVGFAASEMAPPAPPASTPLPAMSADEVQRTDEPKEAKPALKRKMEDRLESARELSQSTTIKLSDAAAIVDGHNGASRSFGANANNLTFAQGGAWAVGGELGGAQAGLMVTNTVTFTAPTVTGIRSIKIDIPRTGVVFNFTKALNVSREPLLIGMSVMQNRVFETTRMSLQLAALLAGLAIFAWQWRQAKPSAFKATVGLALAVSAAGSLFLVYGVLHWVFILAVPVAGLAGLAWVIKRYWPKKMATEEAHGTNGLEPATGGAPPVTALIGLLFLYFCATPVGAQPTAARRVAMPAPSFTNAVSIVSASYVGTVREQVAQFDAIIQLHSASTNQSVLLFNEDVAIQEFKVAGGDAKLARDGRSVGVLLAERGDVTLQFKLLTRLGGDVTRRTLAFGIPPALASQMTLTIDEADAAVEFPSAVAFKRSTVEQQTRVEAVIGAGGEVQLYWTPRVKRAA